MNETIRKFGYPATLIREYAHWVVLLRPAQPTLGSLVLAAKSDATAFADLDPAAFAEMSEVVPAIEQTLKQAVAYERINYLMLMMVDPNVHFHIIPRYNGTRTQGPVSVTDAAWPKPPALGEARPLDAAEIDGLANWLKGLWPDRGN
jgi:diadenosine tetraphosphate (Ap4A) HIT family hydrolase